MADSGRRGYLSVWTGDNVRFRPKADIQGLRMIASRVSKGMVILLGASMATHDVQAKKCGPGLYAVEGSVVDAGGKPAPYVLVGVSWAEGKLPAGPALGRTDTEGRYSITFWLTSLCGKAPSHLSISSSTDTHRSSAALVEVGQSPNVAAPPLRLTEPADSWR